MWAGLHEIRMRDTEFLYHNLVSTSCSKTRMARLYLRQGSILLLLSFVLLLAFLLYKQDINQHILSVQSQEAVGSLTLTAGISEPLQLKSETRVGVSQSITTAADSSTDTSVESQSHYVYNGLQQAHRSWGDRDEDTSAPEDASVESIKKLSNDLDTLLSKTNSLSEASTGSLPNEQHKDISTQSFLDNSIENGRTDPSSSSLDGNAGSTENLVHSVRLPSYPVVLQMPKLHSPASTPTTMSSASPTSGQLFSEHSDGVSPPTAGDSSTGYEPGTIGHSNGARDHCDVSEISSWRTGVITELQPRIEANCEQMISNNRNEIERVKRAIKEWESSETEEEWIQSLNNCDAVVKDFSDNFYNSPEEQAFPLAYIFVVYTNPRQMVRLIKALWRPQNLFCVHPDTKQSEQFIGVFRQLSKCLDNVFLPSKLEKVYYQHHSIMDSQLNCYEDLLHYSPDRWKYVINLCGRELPLRTNREMVKSLKRLNGASAIDSRHVQSKGFLTKDRFTWKAQENYTSGKLYYTRSRLPPPPIPIYKSFNFIAVSRPFVNFFVNDKRAIAFRNYLKDVKIPEEEFYASLIHLPGVPGGNPPHRIKVPVIDKYIWMNKNTQTRSSLESCEGRMVHFICIVTVGDLDQIYRWGVRRQVPAFFFNKYFMEEDHVVMDCMEERLIQQNKKEYMEDCRPNR